ncbi:MAG: hypothetical protein H0T46_16225 [Deltaproteobacteria bacterium]|nr:hypothetical protein [Deltaproteobacteria bacterium]
MAELPVKLGDLAAVPPAMRYQITSALTMLPRDGGVLDGVPLERLARMIDDTERWVGVDPSLAEIGYWMIQAKQPVELRRRGCIWLTRFPSAETAKQLATLVADATTPEPVREQATWTLGYRQLRGMHPSTLWTPDAVQIADEALGKLADAATTAGKIASEQLPHALRHVQSEMTAALFAKAPGLWGDSLEAFASAPLARVLFMSISDIAAQHRMRVLRLIAATLGEEAVPLLVSRSAEAPIDERLEMLFLAIALGGEQHLGRLEDTLAGMKFADLLRQRAKWHVQNRGVVPTVRGLRIARSTAVIPVAERVAKCRQAADDLGALTKFARHPEAYLYKMWGWMVRGAGDPVRARELVSAHPESQSIVRELYLEDLARRGRVKQLTVAAQTLKAADIGALHLAIHGRPFAALELAATARLHTPELVCARALACYRAGRPELTHRILAEDMPPSEITTDEALSTYPGPHEKWMIEHAPELQPAIGALAGGLPGVLGLAKPAPEDAEPDLASLEPTFAVVRRLGRGLPGSTVYLAGEFKHMDKDAIAKAVEAAGARLVNGPFPGTDYYVHGDWCLVQTIAQLERQGARRIRHGELEGV